MSIGINRGYYSNRNKDPIDTYLAHTLRPQRKDKFSRFRGVHKSNDPRKPYKVSVRFRGVGYYAGTFADELEAAKVYNKLVASLFGERAVLNEIPDDLSN